MGRIIPKLADRKRKRGIPQKIKFCGFEFPVVLCEHLIWKDDEEVEHFAKGGFARGHDLIFLDESLTPQYQNEVLMHETLHAIDEVFDVGLEERQVRLLATALNDAIRQNKILRRNPHERDRKRTS